MALSALLSRHARHSIAAHVKENEDSSVAGKISSLLWLCVVMVRPKCAADQIEGEDALFQLSLQV